MADLFHFWPGSIGTDLNGITYWRRRLTLRVDEGPPTEKAKPPPMGVGEGGSQTTEQRRRYTAHDLHKQHQATVAAMHASWLTRRYPAASPTARAILPFLFPGESGIGCDELTDDEEAGLTPMPIPF